MFDLLVSLVVVVGVLGVLHRVLHQLLQGAPLTHEFYQFRNAATTAEDCKFFLFQKKLFDSAAFFLVEELLDLHVSPTTQISTIRHELFFWQ